LTIKSFHIPEEKVSDFSMYIKMGRKTFEKDGNSWSLGRSICRIVEEWAESKGIIKTTSETKHSISKSEFYSQKDWIRMIRTYIKNATNNKSSGAQKALWEIALDIDPNFKIINSEYPGSLYDIIDFLKSKLQINGGE